MDPLFLLHVVRKEIKIQIFLCGIKQIASASININGPCETWNFRGAFFLSCSWMESENQLNGGVIRCISQMFAVLKRLYSEPPTSHLCLKQSVKPSAGDQHAKSSGNRNLLTQGSQHRTPRTLGRLRTADTLTMQTHMQAFSSPEQL